MGMDAREALRRVEEVFIGNTDAFVGENHEILAALRSIVPLECRLCKYSSIKTIADGDGEDARYRVVIDCIYSLPGLLDCPFTGIRHDCPLREGRP